MSDLNKDIQLEKAKQKKNKKMLLYSILVVLLVLDCYVLCYDNTQKYTLTTDAKRGLGVESSTSFSPNTSSSQISSSASLSPSVSSSFVVPSSVSGVPGAQLSPTSTGVSGVSGVQGTQLSSTSSGGASEIRRELKQLFKTYA